jgi:hypothetical protein
MCGWWGFERFLPVSHKGDWEVRLMVRQGCHLNHGRDQRGRLVSKKGGGGGGRCQRGIRGRGGCGGRLTTRRRRGADKKDEEGGHVIGH